MPLMRPFTEYNLTKALQDCCNFAGYRCGIVFDNFKRRAEAVRVIRDEMLKGNIPKATNIEEVDLSSLEVLPILNFKNGSSVEFLNYGYVLKNRKYHNLLLDFPANGGIINMYKKGEIEYQSVKQEYDSDEFSDIKADELDEFLSQFKIQKRI